MNKITNNDFGMSEPNENEIKETIEKVKEKYDVVISEGDATKYAKLYNELGQWFLMEKNIGSKDSITDEMAEEMQEILSEKRGQELDTDDAQTISKESLNIIIPREKERIAEEIREIIVRYKNV